MKGMSLNQIACACQGVYTGDEALKNREVSGVVIDSRQAEPGCLFVALPGYKTDGHRFLREAAFFASRRGAWPSSVPAGEARSFAMRTCSV